MKRAIRNLIAVLIFTLAASAPLAAQEWSAEQKEVLKSVEAFCDAYIRADVEETMSYFHPDWRGWNYAEGLPKDYASQRKIVEYFLDKYTLVSMDVQPVLIQVHANTAIAHFYYRNILRDAAGTDIISSGPWSFTMLKQNNKWVFLSWSWIEK